MYRRRNLNLQQRSPRHYTREMMEQRQRRRRKTSLTLLGLAVPGILFVATKLLQGRHYLLVSFVLLLAILGMFLIDFEYQRPKARDIVVLAVMTAFCVGANEICSHTIPLHAGTSLVVLTGVALGPEAGFLVGALSRLVCNFFAGQGPWTPWQMVAWGILGFLAGLVFNKVELQSRFAQEKKEKKSKKFYLAVFAPIICVLVAWITAYLVYLLRAEVEESFFGWRLYVYGIGGLLVGCLLQRRKLPANALVVATFTFLMVFLLYGGMMNFAAMLLEYQVNPENSPLSLDHLKLLYLTGAPYDAVHAVAAAFCVLLFGDSLLQKLRRIQMKYGLYANF